MDKATQIVESVEFRSLVQTRGRVALSLAITMFVAYFSFILCLAVNKESLAWELFEDTPVGIPIGVGLILFAWVLTGIYISWANLAYDKRVGALKHKFTHPKN